MPILLQTVETLQAGAVSSALRIWRRTTIHNNSKLPVPPRPQAGAAGEKEQQVVSLTAQLVAARAREAAAERRAAGLLAEVQSRQRVAVEAGCEAQRAAAELADKEMVRQ